MTIKNHLTLIVIGFLSLFNGIVDAADKNDYYPLTPGSEWVMQVAVPEENNVTEQKITIERQEIFEGITYSVMKQIDPKNKYTVLVLKNDKGVYWRKLSLKKSFVPEMNSYFVPQAPYVRFPLTKGNKWEWNGIYSLPWSDKKATMKFEVQNDTEEVTVPAGRFLCAKIHVIKYLDKDTDEETSWYAPGVGMVKYQTKKINKELKSYTIK
jgi:hypothetical protein